MITNSDTTVYPRRDIKPDNIVLEGGKAGGRVFLVDFGGVQAAAAGEGFALGSTVIGTYGYMAPEQFRGAAQPASDLYGLAGTLLYLLSGMSYTFDYHGSFTCSNTGCVAHIAASPSCIS